MSSLSQMNLWIFGGIILLGIAVVMAVGSVIIFRIRKKQIEKKLEQKYGDRKSVV